LLPIDDQLKFFVENYGIRDYQEDPRFIGDVQSGYMYKKYLNAGFIDNRTITLQLNTDGAQIFNSSKFSFWPLMGIINESFYAHRRSNAILMAIWYGNRKPPRSAILDPCVRQLNVLEKIGITVNEVQYRVKAIIVTLDTIARALVKNTRQFNGLHGCDFCLHPGNYHLNAYFLLCILFADFTIFIKFHSFFTCKGVQVAKGRGTVRVYPKPKENETQYSRRSTHQHKSDLLVNV
jgi:hypothetical protein